MPRAEGTWEYTSLEAGGRAQARAGRLLREGAYSALSCALLESVRAHGVRCGVESWTMCLHLAYCTALH